MHFKSEAQMNFSNISAQIGLMKLVQRFPFAYYLQKTMQCKCGEREKFLLKRIKTVIKCSRPL